MKFLVLCAVIGVALAKVDYSGHQVYRAYPNQLQNEIIKGIGESLQLDFWSDYMFAGDFVDFRVSPELKPKIDVMLARNRIPHEIFIEDLEFALQKQISSRPSSRVGGFDYANYHTYAEIDQWITDFGASSSLVTIMNMGTGSSLEGRNMRAVKISTGGFARPAFVIDCGLHSREWVTPATCMYTANRLITDYNTDSTVTNLLNNIDFYIIPLANPDGYDYTWTGDRMWRKTRSPSTSNGCLTNCDGVDPNRNWDNHWDTPGGSSTSCCNDAYRGLSPFSEIEIVNQRDFVEAIQNVKGYIDVHAYSQYWMYAYGWTAADTPDEAMLSAVGTASVNAIKAVHGKSYVTGSIADVIYVATGSTADYFYDQGIRCSFAAELRDKGRYGFALPANQIIPTAEEAFAGLMTIATNVENGTC